MQFDRSAINKLLSLNDFQLKIVIGRLLRENNINPAQLGIDISNISAIRHTLSSATDEDIERAAMLFQKMKGGN